jgi:beta-1,4-mannosyl-glycoprotein beta-1,4-N-acetylglucosaminyltransferase
MIIDVFLYNDEIDHLRCRMYELDGVVDRHIAIEGNRTMSGKQKPYYLSDMDQMDRISKVEVVRADLTDLSDAPDQRGPWVQPGTEEHWRRDWKQRNAVMPLLKGLHDDDVIIFSDVDEIPKREVVLDWTGNPNVLGMHLLIFSMRLASSEQWMGSVIGRKRDLGSFAEVRNTRWSFPTLPNAGWHLTWFGGPRAIEKKANQFAHGEMADMAEKLKRYPVERKRPAGGDLDMYDGVVPAWVGDGNAPDSWFMY